jgi:predicted translin family RNA/ssDNA-binding protein
MALNSLRKGDVGRAEKLLDAMEGIYDDLQTLEHTSIVPTFRVKMDAARRIIETTRGDVVTEVRRFSLEQALDRLGKKIEKC